MEVTHRGHRPTVKETEEISMIGAIMILAVVAYLVWTFWGRAFHVIGQYKKAAVSSNCLNLWIMKPFIRS